MFSSVRSIERRVSFRTMPIRRSGFSARASEMSQLSRTRVPPSTGSSS